MIPIPESWPLELQHKCEGGLAIGVVLFQHFRKTLPTLPILIYTAKGEIKTNEFSYYLRKPEFTDTINEKITYLIEKKMKFKN